jgi:hypothetical protein
MRNSVPLPEQAPVPATGAERRRLPRALNALSLNLEDWYQVPYFEGHIPRTEWTAQESRQQSSTARFLDILDLHWTRATFIALGWNAERMPRLVEVIHHRGAEATVERIPL